MISNSGKMIILNFIIFIIVFTCIFIPNISFSSSTPLNIITKRQLAEVELKKWQQIDRSKWIEEFQFWQSKSNLSLGREFELYNDLKINKEILFYEIIENKKPVAILTLIIRPDSRSSIQISKSFSRFFTKDLKSKYIIQLNKGILYAIKKDTNEKFIIQKISQNGIYDFERISYPKSLNEAYVYKAMTPPTALPYMKKLTVPIINQGPYPWCWAASLTSLVQFDLKSKDTIYKITDNNPNKKGDVVKNIIPAFLSYGYAPSVMPPLSIFDTKQYLSMSKPIYMLSQSKNNGHATLICGYYTENEDTYYLMMDPNRREYVILLANDNNVQYYLAGELYQWKYTIQY